MQTSAGARHYAEIPVELAERLRAYSRREGVTLFMTLLAAFDLLLYRYSGQEDVVVGVPQAGRSKSELEGLIGLFVNTLPLRVSLAGDPTFRELLQRVKEAALGAYANQEGPFDKLVEAIEPERSLSQSPLFQVIFALENTPASLDYEGVAMNRLEVERGTARDDLSLFVSDKGGALSTSWEYSTDLVDSETIREMISSYEMLLEAVLAEPTMRIGEFNILSEPQRRRVLVEWNSETSEPAAWAILPEVFEAQVERTPDETAVVFGDRRLTYRELNARANQIAHRLKGLGVGPETPVGIFMERSEQLIVALLAVLKAGGAYVPLDPGYPADRLAFMLGDAEVPVLLTESKLMAELPSLQAEVLALDDDRQFRGEPDTNPVSDLTPDNLAYIIYTSGSTGRPKGVEVTHRTVAHLFSATGAKLGVQQGDVWTVVHSSAFDFSVWEIWGCLLQGGRLVVVPLETVQSSADLFELLCQERVTVLSQTPSALRGLLAARERALYGERDWAVRLIICGGDALDQELALQLAQLPLPVWNFYGPTESSVWTTCSLLAPTSSGESNDEASSSTRSQTETGTPSIGFALPELQIYLLNEQLQPVPPGVPGELFIGGAGLARGYLRRPQLTAEKFIPHPFSDAPGNRLYRTGDLARYRRNGRIEFIGRLDNQVKLRGFRVELGEIENALTAFPGIKQAVVTIREDAGRDQRLVAYVVQDFEGSSEAGLDEAYIDQWQKIYNETYRHTAANDDTRFDITGWNSSYTGQPIPTEEMRIWLDHTVESIRSLKPGRVLEIGCGTGLLLFQIAPHCSQYLGTDFSEIVINRVQAQIDQAPELSQVSLLQRTAKDFDGIQTDWFDVVILNSVVQYFPNGDYLIEVLRNAARVLRPGGSIFIGDVRSLPLLEAFHTSVETYKASPSLSIEQLRQRVRERLEAEDELVVDPKFFDALRKDIPGIAKVSVRPKQGGYDNELSRFRYDVVITVGGPEHSSGSVELVNWTKKESLEDLRAELQRRPVAIGRRGIPNRRVETACEMTKLLREDRSLATAADLSRAISRHEPEGIEPDELLRLAASENYRANLSWINSDTAGCFDILFTEADAKGDFTFPSSPNQRDFTNQPARKTVTLDLIPRLRVFLREKLPDYMMPAAFVILDRFPLTDNGKLDRKALPAPERARPPVSAKFEPPRDPAELALARIWTEVLGLDRVGVNDNFFELGGHSLLATQVVSRVRDVFKIEMSLQNFFANPTIAECVGNLPAYEPDASLPLQKSAATTAPQSVGQQRLWFTEQLVPGTAVFNVPAALHLTRDADLQALELSLKEIGRRHEALRTIFHMVDGQPVQTILPELDWSFPIIELGFVPMANREAELRRQINHEAQVPFDLEHGPLWRARLLKYGADEKVLLLTMHHIIADGWSWKVFFTELGRIYEAFVQGKPSPLPELPIQYADFAVWQNEWLASEQVNKQLLYWRQQLSGAPTLLDLPTDKPRPVKQGFRGACHSLLLDPLLSQRLRELARNERATLFMTMLAAFNILLHRYTGQEDILVGSPIANRPRSECEKLIGFFLNNLVLRTKISPAANFRKLLQQVSSTAIDAYANQDVPFERIVEALNPARDRSRPPIFQVFFNLLNFAERIELPGLTESSVSPVEIWSQPETAGSQFDLTLYVGERIDSIQLVLLYNADIFGHARIAVMLRQFEYLLEQIVAQPGAAISDYSLVYPLSLVPDPSGKLDEPKLEPITEVFLARAKELPDQIALKYGSTSVTYGELARQARSIARALIDDGVKKGDVIAVSGPQSPDLIASLLGVLLAGGVLLTLERNLPQERQRVMLSEAGARRLIFSGQLRPQDHWLDSVPGLKLFAGEQSDQAPDSELASPNPDDAAYIFFTSGTTGVPKGVLGSHQGLSHFLKWQREQFQVGPLDRSAQLTGLSFDVVLRDIFLPLTSGATLHLPDIEVASSAQIISWLQREQISILHTVPSLAQAWMNDLPAPVFLPSLRWVFFAGEPLTDALVRQWRTSFSSSASLANLYGPTETTLAKCFYVVPQEPEYGVQPVGRPLPNTQALVFQSERRCGIGEPGEIVIRTPFRTLGYMNAAAEQAARFIPNKFTADPNDLIYRTGDRGRYRPDGLLEILGRLDDQVKIRGVRVEPAEVNAMLARHPLVAASVVISILDERGEKALAAYVVPDAPDEFDLRQVRSFMEQQLPSTLVPTYFVPLPALPLTANGKVDRSALPPPDLSFAKAQQEFIAPRDATEELIAEAWGEVLGLKRIGIHDNFFEVGGHSLNAMQVISRLNGIFKIELPLAELFTNATVEGLAAVIEDHLVEQLESMSEDEAQQLFD